MYVGVCDESKPFDWTAKWRGAECRLSIPELLFELKYTIYPQFRPSTYVMKRQSFCHSFKFKRLTCFFRIKSMYTCKILAVDGGVMADGGWGK